jgi:protein-L-isoaspartate(D-aspartate) O-methyltransferase
MDDGPRNDRPDDTGSPSALRNSLVDRLKSRGQIEDPRVEATFRAVKRHRFPPQFPVASVYEDQGFITKSRDGVSLRSSTGPSVMAYMLQDLDLRPGHNVLEIGAGTGYNAARVVYMAGVGGNVVTVDVDLDIVEDARRNLSASGIERVKAICADGGYGYAGDAPYDRIILTTGALDITPAWREQLKPGGRLVLPLSIRGAHQGIMAFDNRDDRLTSGKIRPTGFIPLRGAFAGPTVEVPIGPQRDAAVNGDQIDLDAETIYKMLTGHFADVATGVRVTRGELNGLWLWLAARGPKTCEFNDADGPDRTIPPFYRSRNAGEAICWTDWIIDELWIAVFNRGTGQAELFELLVRSYGPGRRVAERLAGHVSAWEAAVRPPVSDVRITMLPIDTPYQSGDNEVVVPK